MHRKELVEQAARHCSNAYPDKIVEIEMAKQRGSGYADITVASVQSILSSDRLIKFRPDRFKLVLVDEAHHIVAKSYLQVLEHFRLYGQTSPEEAAPALVGVSATLSRFDGLKLGAAIDHIVYHKDYVDMIGEKWLSDVAFTTIKSHVDLSKIKSPAFGDFPLDALSRAVNTDEANEITVRSWMAKAQDRKSTLVFCVDTAHVRSLSAKFNEYGIEARCITGKDRVSVRSDRLDAFRKGAFPVLLNCGVFTEGTDIPNIDCVLLARPTRSRNLLVQMIGRGMRLHPGKKDCHVIDMVASLGIGIVTVPTLWGLDPQEMLQNTSVGEMKEMKAARENVEGLSSSQVRGAPIGKVTFTDYDSVYDLISDSSSEKHIRAISRLAWVEVDKNRYLLTNRHDGYVEIKGAEEADEGFLYTINYNTKLSSLDVLSEKKNWRPYKRTRRIGTSATFEGAVRAAETFVEGNSQFERFFIARNASWRTSPPSDGQMKFLNSIREPGDEIDERTITKGKAADMITKMKHGAKGRYSRIKVKARQIIVSRERSEEKERRETIRVGPLEI